MKPNAKRDPGAHVPSAVDEQVVRADVDDAERDRRLDDPGRRADEIERGERQRDAVSDGERRHDERQLPDRAAEQQQPDEKQQMVRANQDVMNPRRHEPARRRPGRPDACRRNIRTAPCRDRESPASARRPRRCSRRSGGSDRTETAMRRPRSCPGARSRPNLSAQPDRLPIGDDFRRRPCRCQHASVRRDLEPAGEQSDDGLAVA